MSLLVTALLLQRTSQRTLEETPALRCRNRPTRRRQRTRDYPIAELFCIAANPVGSISIKGALDASISHPWNGIGCGRCARCRGCARVRGSIETIQHRGNRTWSRPLHGPAKNRRLRLKALRYAVEELPAPAAVHPIQQWTHAREAPYKSRAIRRKRSNAAPRDSGVKILAPTRQNPLSRPKIARPEVRSLRAMIVALPPQRSQSAAC